MKYPFSFFLCLFLSLSALAQSPINGHSHNDYEQKRPLKTAFDAHIGSIEADVYLVKNQLYVAHNAKDIKPSRTLESLYLKPLAKAIRRKKAYKMILLIDIKSAADSTLQVIVQQIAQYSAFSKPNTLVQFVISGNRPRPENWALYPSFIQFDGRPYETYTLEQWQRIGMVSDSFDRYNNKTEPKKINQETFDKMKTIVNTIHEKGKKIRFWATPDTEDIWKILADMGVDFINTDMPSVLGFFLKNR